MNIQLRWTFLHFIAPIVIITKRDGTTPVECVKDAKSAMRWLRANAADYGIDPHRLAAGGGSAGGHIAAAAAHVTEFNEDGEDASAGSVPSALMFCRTMSWPR